MQRTALHKLAVVARSRPCARSVVTMAAAVQPPAAYDELCKKLRDLNALNGISGLLDWDEMVMMPEKSGASRTTQKTALAGVIHDKETDKEIGALLQKLKDVALGDVESANVREATREYAKASSLTKELAQRKARLNSEGYEAWTKARTAKDFSLFAPKLKEIVELTREIAAITSPDKPLYDAALDNFEKGMTAERIDEVFSQVRAELPPLIAALRAAPAASAPDASWLEGSWDVKRQADLCMEVVRDLGFDETIGRLDVSVHPFTGGADPTDVRMTTRFKENDITEGLTGAVHECGHALYEQGRNADDAFRGLPVSAALSMGVHESQSLLWERMVALSPEFCTWLMPKARATFPEFGDGKSPQELYRAINKMKDPSFIRVESDEVTYPMHIILRYEIEKALLLGELEVDDVPKAWNEKMEVYLGCKPADDAQGCLQDVHWSMGAIGYFPTYTLGAMYAVQIFAAAEAALPTLRADIAAGTYGPLREWLREKVHRLGSVPANGDDLMVAVTGEPLNVGIFMKYLKDKYGALYGVTV